MSGGLHEPAFDEDAAALRERFDAQRLGLAAFERLQTYLWSGPHAQHIHAFEDIGNFRCRHIPNRNECWLCVQLDTIRAALDNAYERSLPAVLREVENA